jgi:hypothetical protein
MDMASLETHRRVYQNRTIEAVGQHSIELAAYDETGTQRSPRNGARYPHLRNSATIPVDLSIRAAPTSVYAFRGSRSRLRWMHFDRRLKSRYNLKPCLLFAFFGLQEIISLQRACGQPFLAFH